MRPRRSSAFTANGRMVSSLPVCAGSRTGMSTSGLVIAPEYRRQREFGGLRRHVALRLTAVRLQAPGQNPLLRVQPVLGLVEHHRMRAVDHFVGDLFAAMRRQAMHEDGVRLGARHQPRIDLIALEQVMAARAVAIAHGDPGVGDDAVGALDGLFRVGADVIAAPDDLIQSMSGFFGASSGGVATRRRNSNRSAACIHEVSTLLASPVQATVRPRIGPRCSSNVMTSAITWQGCERRVRPLITGTVA
jgi:hypothetical protein